MMAGLSQKPQTANRGESALTALNTLRCVIPKAVKVVKVGGVGSGK